MKVYMRCVSEKRQSGQDLHSACQRERSCPDSYQTNASKITDMKCNEVEHISPAVRRLKQMRGRNKTTALRIEQIDSEACILVCNNTLSLLKYAYT